MTTPSALHSKATPRWGTPGHIVTRARALLGGRINLDPASSPEFNTIVQADRILTVEDNGLIFPWAHHYFPSPGNFTSPLVISPQTVFLNPPGGLVYEFWDRLLKELASGVVSAAFWVGFSVEQLCTLQDAELYPLDFSTCILRKRIPFLTEALEKGGSPSHGNYVTGLNVSGEIFSSLFGDLGRVSHGQAALP